MKIFLFHSTVRTATLHAFHDAQGMRALEMLGDGELKPFRVKISTTEMYLICCCRFGYVKQDFETRYGRGF